MLFDLCCLLADKALPDGVICRAKAKYAYTANNDDEHTFNAGILFLFLVFWREKNDILNLRLLFVFNF